MLEHELKEVLRPIVEDLVSEYIEQQGITLRQINIHLGKEKENWLKKAEKAVTSIKGVFHHQFEEIMEIVFSDIPLMLIGPAGSGKNVVIQQVSEALGLQMYYTNNVSNEFKITGFIDAGGIYRETEFYKAFKNGGIFFLDEIDSSDPSALIILNSAISNGYVSFPHERVEKHDNFRCIAAANTWGTGRDNKYVGRNALDAASLDRFVTLHFHYDHHLEQTLFPNDEILKFVWELRKSVNENQIRHVVSTRMIKYSYEMLACGIPVDTIVRSVVIKGMNADDISTLISDMSVPNRNAFMEAFVNARERSRR